MTPSACRMRGGVWLGAAFCLSLLAPVVGVGDEPGRKPPLLPCAASATSAVFKPLSEIRPQTKLQGGQLPADCSAGLFAARHPASRAALQRGEWSETVCHWAAPDFFHRPLYFDEVPLERYGHTMGRFLQPGLSGVHFFGSAALLPYKMLVDAPCRHISPLAYYRPGSDAPALREGLRLEVDPLWAHPRAAGLEPGH